MNIKKQITICKTDTEIKIYPESKNELGLWIAHPPCFVVSINDVRNMESVINIALQYSNSGVSVTEETAKNVLKEMRIKSWNILYKSHRIISFSLAEKKLLLRLLYIPKKVFSQI